MIANKSLHALPRASAMIEALRGLGYSTATALADIIDNSIAAHANRVDILFSWDKAKSSIAVLDNGVGMNRTELILAMHLGEKSPLDEREEHDLGRFGLGLKTASFSQCRRLTVSSKKKLMTSACLHWDLDVLASSKDDGWYLLEGYAPESESFLSPLVTQDQGTIVLWEKLDRIFTSGFREQNFLDLIDKVEMHLSMVFHRFISGTARRFKLYINGRLIEPWDPFLLGHSATWSSPIQRIHERIGAIEVQCHVLPHQDRLTEKEYKKIAGPDGWTSQQGFYVYRNQRLLVAGSWLGLGRGRSWTKEDAHRLARIRLDLPNTADADWKIDIRKSNACPPVLIRERLTLLAEDVRERARSVFAHRGKIVRVGNGSPITQAWRAEHSMKGMRYKIDLNHPAIAIVLADAGGLADEIRAMLRIIEETIPVQKIWLDSTEQHETPRTNFTGDSTVEVASILSVMYRSMVFRKDMSPEFARQQLLITEPFNNYPDLVAALPNEPIN